MAATSSKSYASFPSIVLARKFGNAAHENVRSLFNRLKPFLRQDNSS